MSEPSVEWRWVVDDPTDLTDVARLFADYQRELGIDLGFQGFDRELASLPGKYGPPDGALLLAKNEKVAVACGALWRLEPEVAEIKRLYVAPEFRGNRMGGTLMETLMERAREMGYRTVRLDTLRRLEAANAMYRRFGFIETEAYNVNPEPDVAYFERKL